MISETVFQKVDFPSNRGIHKRLTAQLSELKCMVHVEVRGVMMDTKVQLKTLMIFWCFGLSKTVAQNSEFYGASSKSSMENERLHIFSIGLYQSVSNAYPYHMC